MDKQNFLPPAKASKATQIPENAIRRMIKQGTCPGFYSGNRFMVNIEKLKKQLGNQQGYQQIEETEVQKLTVTVKEMANMIGVSLPIAYKLTQREGFPAIRISDQLILIPIERLKKWLNEASAISEEKQNDITKT